MICAIINGLVQSGGNDEMLSSCLQILGSFALCSPEQVIEDLGRTNLLQPFGSSIGGMGVFAGSLLQVLLVKTEQNTGNYPLALAALDLTKIMVEKGVEVEVISSLVMYMVRDLLVNHGNWKYQHPHQRWQITTQALQVGLTLLAGTTSRTSTRNLRRGLLETFLFDSIIQDFILQVLSIGPTLEELHYNRAVRPKELEWVQCALHKVLLLLHHVVLEATVGPASKEYPGMSLLEQSLLCKFAGSLPAVAVIASFFSFSRNVDMQLASLKALTSICVSAQKARSHPISIASYISTLDQRTALRSSMCQFLSEDSWLADHGLFDAAMDLLSTAVKYQPSLVALFLFPTEQTVATNAIKSGASTPQSGSPVPSFLEGKSSGVSGMLWKVLLKSAELVKSHPQVLSRVLFLLASIWQGGIEYLHIVEAFRQQPNFWKTLTSGLSYGSGSSQALEPSVPSLNQQEILAYAYRYKCEASILSIIACDVFLQTYILHTGNNPSSPKSNLQSGSNTGIVSNGNGASALVPASSKSGALEVISEWARVSATSSILKSYAVCAFDQEAILRAKAEVRVLLVGMMGKILAGDTRGVSAALLQSLQLTISQVGYLTCTCPFLGEEFFV